MIETVIVTVVVVVVVAGVVIYVGLLLFNPVGMAVPGPCRLITRTFLRDYCSGACPPGQSCVPTTTRRYLLLGTQPATCACGTVVPVGAGTATVASGTEGTSSIAPITGGTTTDRPSTSGETDEECVCTQAEEDAEFQQMTDFYTAAVNNARGAGNYQAADDPGYSDPGLGFHRVGNCADWQQVS